jgi:hypothetical protein
MSIEPVSASHVWWSPPRLARLLFGTSGDRISFDRIFRIVLSWVVTIWGLTFAICGEATHESAGARLALLTVSVAVVVITVVGVVIALEEEWRH